MVHSIEHFSSTRGMRRSPEVRVLNDLPHSLCPGSVNAEDQDSPFFRQATLVRRQPLLPSTTFSTIDLEPTKTEHQLLIREKLVVTPSDAKRLPSENAEIN